MAQILVFVAGLFTGIVTGLNLAFEIDLQFLYSDTRKDI